MLKSDKERIVAELAERLKSTQTLFVADYRGLSVSELDDLRTKLIEHGGRFTVVKNTLTRRAAEAAGAEALLAMLEGPTAIAFIEADGDMVAVAKALADSARTTRILAIRGGILDGAPIGEEDVRNLATLPPLDVLRGQVLGAVTSPLVTIVGLISAPLRDLVGLIDARIEQLKEQGDTGEAPAAESEGQTPEGSVPAVTAGGPASDEEPAVAESEGQTPEGSVPADTAEEPASEEEPAAEEAPVAEAEATEESTAEAEEAAEEEKEA